MIRKIIILILLLSIYPLVSGQSLQMLLKQVSDKNPEIEAYRRLLDARRYEARTGLTPSNPFVSAGYMPGTPGSVGTKKLWSVTQSFDFPTKYLLQKKINMNTIVLAEQEFNQGRLMILLDAELSAFDLIYDLKALKLLKERKEGYDRLRDVFKKMLDNGGTTILEYNKLLLALSDVNLEITRREARTDMMMEKLRYMSGADATLPEINEYPAFADPALENLIVEKAAIHPAFLIPETEYQISLREVKLSRTGSLPGFQIGYSSEIVPGETFTGPFAGLSIPLWANSNRTKTASAMALHSSAVRDAELLRLKSQLRNEFTNMKALERSISEVKEILVSSQGTKFPDIALLSGEISISTYILYLDVLYETEDKLLKLEYEYQRSLATLHDHELLK